VGKFLSHRLDPFFININQGNVCTFTAEEMSRSGSYAASGSGY
jgi:hypothetical protein